MDEKKIWFFITLCVFFIFCIVIHYAPQIYIYLLKKVYKQVSWLLRGNQNSIEFKDEIKKNKGISEKSVQEQLDKKRENQRSHRRTKKFNKNIARTIVFVVAIVLFIGLISIIFSYLMPSMQGEKAGNSYTGPLGDLFNGLLTPLLTFLTFCGLLVTIMMQNLQMKATLQELELTRKEMSKSSAALEEQVNNSRSQKFDANFYSLLEYQDRAIETIFKKTDPSSHYKDRGFYINNFNLYAKYLSINYQILKFIKESEDSKVINNAEAKRYVEFLVAVIPEDLLVISMIYSYRGINIEYRNIAYDYSLFKNVDYSKFKVEFIGPILCEMPTSNFENQKGFNDFLTNYQFKFDNVEKIKSMIDHLKQSLFASDEKQRISYNEHVKRQDKIFNEFDNFLKKQINLINYKIIAERDIYLKFLEEKSMEYLIDNLMSSEEYVQAVKKIEEEINGYQ